MMMYGILSTLTTRLFFQWTKTTTRPGDPPLSALGHQQARETGAFLNNLLARERISAENITWLSSPFLRTLQTSNEAIAQLRQVRNNNQLRILPESSVFEWDGKNGEWHASLPPIEERVHYFPRLDLSYQSMFVPTIPEPRTAFHARCDRSLSLMNKRFPFRPRNVIVVVTHAAACISMVRSAINGTLADVTPAAPCSVYKLTRTSGNSVWSIDSHDIPKGMNGHSAHLSDMGVNTVPWNHFADISIHEGYTGPKTSRFAPKSLKSEL
jgi:broad specificity phosphatase PhoE